jgi:antitoxin StbD
MMKAITTVLSSTTIGITELKRNPMIVVEEAEGETVAVLNRNKPVFYAVPAEAYEAMLERLEDAELAAIVRAREGQPRIKVDWDDL